MFRRPLIGWSASVFSLLLLCGNLSAQAPEGQPRRPGGPGGPGGFGFFGGGPGGGAGAMGGMLLGNEKVQKELELLPDQIEKLTKLRDGQQEKMREMFSGFRDLSEEERRKKFEGMREKLEEAGKENQNKMNEILLPHQQDRLKQIGLQLRGFGAIDDPEVAADLKISDDQKDQIRTVREKQREKMTAMFRDGGQGGDREAMREKFQQLRTENEKEVLEVLTEKQRDQFEKMKGEKFEIDFSSLRPGGPGGPGGRFGGDRRPGGDRPEGDRPNPDTTKKPEDK